MLKIKEVYQRIIKEYDENPDGTRRVVPRKAYSTRDCLLNPNYIVAVYDHEFTSSTDIQMLGSLPKNSQYCRVVVDGNSFRSSEIIVATSFPRLVSLLK